MRVLVAEDHAALAAQLRAALARAGFAVDHAADGETALHLGACEPYDVVVLDLGLPALDGLAVLRQWRAAGRDMPVLILTVRDAWTEKVQALNAGADDYLTKPFVMDEVLARLHALIRRTHGVARPLLTLGALEVDPIARRATWEGEARRLTALEFRLLSYLAHHAGRPVSKAELTEHVYAQDFDRDSNTLEVIVGRLRRKLAWALIETVRGEGYRIAAPRPR